MSGVEGPDRPEAAAPGMPPAPVPPGGGYPPPPAYQSPGPYRPGAPDVIGGRQTGERARKALWAGLGAFVAQAACSVVLFVLLRDYYRTIFDAVFSGRRLTPAQTTPPTSAGYLVATALSQVASVVLLVVGVLFLIWFHKALSNARALGMRLTHSPGWGIAGFFVPIINLWFPYQSMRDLFPAGHPSRPLVGRWWACYLGASFVTTAAGITAFVAPAVAVALVLVVAGLYTVAAITLRELIAASTQVAEDTWITAPSANGGLLRAPGGAAAPDAGPTGWMAPPAGPPKDPWNRS